MSTFNADSPAIDPRLTAAREWLKAVLPRHVQTLRPASEDASFRRYFRVDLADSSLVLMDAPPELEPVRPFMRIAECLAQCGVHVPEIIAADPVQGFVLLEDLGDQSYFAALGEAPGKADQLYRDAMDTLLAIQVRGREFQQSLPSYDEPLLRRELALFPDWLCSAHLGLGLTASESKLIADVFDLLCTSALAQPLVFVHRDYHSRNLMVCAERNPGVLDFQDAVEGPITYDLVSLLKDCYVRWPQTDRVRWVADYHSAAASAGLPVGNPDEFAVWLDLMGVQRHLKAAGIFARLNHRDGKTRYLDDVPRTLEYILEAAGVHPVLGGFAEFLEHRVLPGLTDPVQ